MSSNAFIRSSAVVSVGLDRGAGSVEYHSGFSVGGGLVDFDIFDRETVGLILVEGLVVLVLL